MSKNDKTAEEKMKQLEEIQEWFNGEDFELEKASEKYKEAKKISESVKKNLEKLENEIEVLGED